MNTFARPWLLVFTVVLIAGCSRFDTQYGISKGGAGNKSLNGFGALRTALAMVPEDVPDDVTADPDSPVAELRTRDMVRLSERELGNDAIVWLPTQWSPANLPAVETWLGRWLDQGGRTLVFIVPDDGSTEAYFQEAIDIAPPGQRLEYRRQLAQQINERLLTDSRRTDIALKNYFIAKALPYRVHLPSRQSADFEIQPAAPENDSQSKREDAPLADVMPASESDGSVESEFSEQQWEEDELEMDEMEMDDIQHWSVVPRRPAAFEPLMQEDVQLAGREKTLTTLARCVDERWPDSQILIVASGSLLTNFAMTAAPAQEMANRIRSEIRKTSDAGDDERIAVAFLSTDSLPLSISNVQPGAPNTKGWELMTQMPLSLINMHVAFLGVVLCLMLLPVFGRPRQVRYSRPTHFGNHLSAMATLMRRNGGVEYAHAKISHYLRHVRGETSGPWVLPEENKAVKTKQ